MSVSLRKLPRARPGVRITNVCVRRKVLRVLGVTAEKGETIFLVVVGVLTVVCVPVAVYGYVVDNTALSVWFSVLYGLMGFGANLFEDIPKPARRLEFVFLFLWYVVAAMVGCSIACWASPAVLQTGVFVWVPLIMWALSLPVLLFSL